MTVLLLGTADDDKRRQLNEGLCTFLSLNGVMGTGFLRYFYVKCILSFSR